MSCNEGTMQGLNKPHGGEIKQSFNNLFNDANLMILRSQRVQQLMKVAIKRLLRHMTRYGT